MCLNFKFRVGVGYFRLNLVELHHLGSFPCLWHQRLPLLGVACPSSPALL